MEYAKVTPAENLLDDRQRKYALRGLKQTNLEPLNELLPQTLKYGDEDAQPGQYSSLNLNWIDYRNKARNLG